jgi:hypothetical protein
MARSRGHHEQNSIGALRRKAHTIARNTLETNFVGKQALEILRPEAVIPREGPLTALAAAARTLQSRRHNVITRYYGCHPVNPAH